MKKFLKMVVALLTMLTMANCSGDDSAVEPETVVTPEPTTPTVYRLEVEAQLDPLAAESRRQLTRALSLDGDVLNKTWGASDKVNVYLGSAWSVASGGLKPASSGVGKTSTKLSGDIIFNVFGAISTGEALHFVFPGDKDEWKYTGQTGTPAKLATDYDYATGASTVKAIDGTTHIITANPVTLSNEQAIVKFVLKNSSGNDNLKVKYLTISAAGNQLVQTKGAFLNHPSNTSTYGPITVVPSSATNELWVALRNEKSGADKYVLTATDGSGNDYRFSKSSITFENGKAYEVEVNMKSVNYSGDISQPLTLEAVAAGTVSVTQFIDGTDLEYSSDKVNWYQKGTNGISINLDPGQKLYLRGNNSTLGTVTGTGSFMHIKCSADCYIYGNIMSLVDKTSFSSKTTYDGTFYSLFSDNTHLKNHGTRNLILPITTLPANCYNKTFYGCTGLTRIVCLATDISAAGCVTEWFSGVTTTGTFYRASGASSIWSTATNVPSKWTIEEYKQ